MVVGAAGTMLTQLMAKAMNRSLFNVLFGSMGAGGGAEIEGSMKEVQSDITTKQQYLDGLIEEARHAEMTDGQSEATMLLRRLQLFFFTQKLPAPPAWIPDCPRCFARVVIQHASAHHHAHCS